MQEMLDGKDQAITALSKSLMEKGMEHEKMSEMVNQFKNKLILENCFHTNFGSRRCIKSMPLKKTWDEVTLGFMRDRTFEEEFFLVIEAKEFN